MMPGINEETRQENIHCKALFRQRGKRCRAYLTWRESARVSLKFKEFDWPILIQAAKWLAERIAHTASPRFASCVKDNALNPLTHFIARPAHFHRHFISFCQQSTAYTISEILMPVEMAQCAQ
jgi:hypothetical protein